MILQTKSRQNVFKARSKRDKLEQNDFYDSDEDNFYDRTGDLENKRKKRKLATTGKQKKEKAISYDEIMENLNKTQSEYDSLIRKIERGNYLQSEWKINLSRQETEGAV